ncbi:uncharacterized protein LOC103065745 isoform X2 [Python bivittatus]|uniref:Uncharacterized protein LOC103065745 isoform X2 n=1 Tax=Python bivittatus TaxID=176946 RepID=A0A9F5N3D3_PYTBI|nr:uncharacterized protein LOC103065745 isoform X2 [Python bivittatus]
MGAQGAEIQPEGTNLPDIEAVFLTQYSAQKESQTSEPPESVELDPMPEMEVGKPYDLTCQVSGVAPIRNLTMTLLKGAEQLLVKTFEDHTAPEAGPVVVKHRIIAQRNDHNKIVYCHTSLDLRPRGPLLKKNNYSILKIFGISEETVSPQNGAVTQRNLPWLDNNLTSDSLIDWSPSISPGVERTIKQTYQPLVRLTLELQKPSPGQSWTYHLICHILRVHPCCNLTVTFFKGSKSFNSPSSINCTWHEVTNITIPLPVILHPEDHGQKAYCHTAVYFSLHEPAYQTTSSGLSLKTDESYLAITVAAVATALLLVSVLVVFLIFIIRLWIRKYSGKGN